MTVEYENTMQDYTDYVLHGYYHSASVKRSILITRISVPVMGILIALALFHVTKTPAPHRYDISIIISLLWVVFYPKYLDRVIRRNITKMMKGKSEGLLGNRQLSVTPECIVSKAKTGEERNNSIEKIEQTDKYIFIYTNAMSAHVVPKRVFKNAQEQQEFLEILSSIPKL